MRAAFNGDGFVDDVTLNPRRSGQSHFKPAHAAHNAAINHHIIGNTFAFYRCAITNGEKMGANVALNSAFNLDIARGYQIARNREV